MAVISAIKLPNGTTYDIKDNEALHGGQQFYLVKGTQTATTAAWTGEIDINALYDGLTIAYYLPRTSASNATLNLTLADGTTTGAINVYVTSTTRMGTHYGAGSTILLTYWSAGSIEVNGTATTENRWTHGDYWNSNTIGEYAGSCTAGTNGMARYSLTLKVTESTWESLVTTSSTGTSKVKISSGFLLDSPIIYQSGGTYTSGNNAGQSSCWSTASFDTRYSINASNTWSVAGRSFYLVGTITNNKFYLKDTTWWADALPNAADGYYYWYVGQMYSAYQCTLYPVHPIYYYNNGIKIYAPVVAEDAKTVTGHTVAIDVPSNAKFTDTVTTVTTSGNGNAVTAITASNGALTVTKGTTFLTSHQDISGKADKATTLAGYGITDAKIASGVITLGSDTITPLTSSSTLNAAKLSGAIPSAVTATTQTAGNNSTKIATTAYVDSAISGLPTPMQFIGTVGTNGTVTWANLPAASGHNGYTYKVITAHIAETGKPAADVGDALISNGTEWIVIPAGDETATQSATTGISIANHGTGTVIGVQSTTTSVTGVSGSVTASHVKSGGNGTAPTLGGKIPTVSASDITVPIKNTSATTVPIKNSSATSVPVVSSSADATLSFSMDNTDSKKLKISWSATPTRTVFGTAVSIYGVQSSTTSVTGVQSSTTTASKVTVGTSNTDYAVTSAGSASNWVFEDVTVPKAATSATTVPIKNSSASTFVTGTTHTITDNGHTHTI